MTGEGVLAGLTSSSAWLFIMPYLFLIIVPTSERVAWADSTLVHPALKERAEFLSLPAEKSLRRKNADLGNAEAAPKSKPSTSELCLLPEPFGRPRTH